MGAAGVFAAGRSLTTPLINAWLTVPPGHYDPADGHSPSWGKAGPAGLLIWLFLGVALFFLVKSMNRHIRRVNDNRGSFAGGDEAEGETDDAGSADVPDPAEEQDTPHPTDGDGAEAASSATDGQEASSSAWGAPGMTSSADPDEAATVEPERAAATSDDTR